MDAKKWDEFFSEGGPKVHDDPVRFAKMAELCRGKVLDVGCGTGSLADFFSGDYTGIDLSETAIKMARETRREGALFVVRDIFHQLDLRRSYFDTIVMGEFLEHFKDANEVIKKVLPFLSPEGQLLISVPNFDRVPDADHITIFTVPQIRRDFAKYGRVKFHTYPGFQERIIFSVQTGDYNRHDLALAMILKNEEKGVETAVISCLDFVDEVVLSVDKGTTDGTLDVARLYADELLIHTWENSFCKARNFVQSKVSCDWVLSLDGHERVEKHDRIDEALKKGADAIMVELAWETGFKFYFPRVIKKEIQWEHDVHNSPMFKKEIELPGFIIMHDRENLQAAEAVEIRDRQRDEMVRSIMSVSYTHLTLPTIYSV